MGHEGANLEGGGKVVDLDGVIGAARDGDRPGDCAALDGDGVGRVGEEGP